MNKKSYFDIEPLEKAKNVKKPHYVIGVDALDKNHLSYCLVRKAKGIVEVLLTKVRRNEIEFRTEVNNIAKYFEAEIIEELNT